MLLPACCPSSVTAPPLSASLPSSVNAGWSHPRSSPQLSTIHNQLDLSQFCQSRLQEALKLVGMLLFPLKWFLIVISLTFKREVSSQVWILVLCQRSWIIYERGLEVFCKMLGWSWIIQVASVSRSGLQGSCKMLGGVGGLCIKEADCPAVIEGRFLTSLSLERFCWDFELEPSIQNGIFWGWFVEMDWLAMWLSLVGLAWWPISSNQTCSPESSLPSAPSLQALESVVIFHGNLRARTTRPKLFAPRRKKWFHLFKWYWSKMHNCTLSSIFYLSWQGLRRNS